MKIVVIYARVSSREQQEEGYSIQAQQRLLREYASKNGFRIEREFVDVETAKDAGRKYFGEMVTFLKRSQNCRTVLVEKTDRLYRNLEDAATFEKLGFEVHFVKTGTIVSKNAKPQTKFMHDIELAQARFYSGNLREEVIKGMREKAEEGIYPGRAPFGYCNDRSNRNIQIHSLNSPIVTLAFELYAKGGIPLAEIRKALKSEFGKTLSKGYIHRMLTNPFYIGFFEWSGNTYRGKHETFISNDLFQRVQGELKGHNKGKYGKHDIAFRGLLSCAHDHCTMTTEKKKGKYVYYRCSGYKGRCDTPRFTESEVSEKLGSILKNIYIPDAIVKRIENALASHQERTKKDSEVQRSRMEQRLVNVRAKMDRAYDDKLSGTIDEAFWQRKMNDWRAEEQQIQMALDGFKQANNGDRLLDAKRILELANKAHFLYLTQNPAEQARSLKLVLLNCEIDELSVYPTYRKPFDLIFQRVKTEEWSGRADLNCRPLAPQASALPG